MSETHFYTPQSAPLNGMVRSFWQIRDKIPFKKETIVPKGVVEIIFNFSEGGLNGRLNERAFELPACFINGFTTLPIQLQLPERLFFFGVKLQPVALRSLFNLPASELFNRLVDLYDLDGGFRELYERIAHAGTFDQRMNIFSAWALQKQLLTDKRERMFNLILCDHHQPVSSVSGLSDFLCYSPRQLSRKFTALTGFNTEEFLHYRKYLRSLSLLHDQSRSLTDIAYAGGFSDQSHFIKSFRHFANMTPGEYRQRKKHIPGHFFEDVR